MKIKNIILGLILAISSTKLTSFEKLAVNGMEFAARAQFEVSNFYGNYSKQINICAAALATILVAKKSYNYLRNYYNNKKIIAENEAAEQNYYELLKQFSNLKLFVTDLCGNYHIILRDLFFKNHFTTEKIQDIIFVEKLWYPKNDPISRFMLLLKLKNGNIVKIQPTFPFSINKDNKIKFEMTIFEAKK